MQIRETFTTKRINTVTRPPTMEDFRWITDKWESLCTATNGTQRFINEVMSRFPDYDHYLRGRAWFMYYCMRNNSITVNEEVETTEERVISCTPTPELVLQYVRDMRIYNYDYAGLKHKYPEIHTIGCDRYLGKITDEMMSAENATKSPS